MGLEQCLEHCCREITFVTEQLAEQTSGQAEQRFEVMDIPWGQEEIQQLPPIIEDQMQLET